MKHYVLCLPSNTHGRVLLFHKTNGPEGARGYNGFGGRVEEGESLAEAAAREFGEESGISIGSSKWTQVATLSRPHAQVHVFTAVLTGAESAVAPQYREYTSMWFFPEDLHRRTMPLADNIDWLVTLVLSNPKFPFKATVSLGEFDETLT